MDANWEVVKVIGAIVGLAVGLLALAKTVGRAFLWLGFLPEATPDEIVAETELMFEMGTLQLYWTRFRLWCALGPVERLPWHRRVHFAISCPLVGHELERFRPGQSFGGKCKRCSDVIVRQTEEDLDLWERKGWHPFHLTTYRVRPAKAIAA